MKRKSYFILIVVTFLLLAAAAVWLGGGTGRQGVYRVLRAADGQTDVLVLTIAQPGLFVDLSPGRIESATAGGRPVKWLKPWWSDRVRVLALGRGPVEIVLAHGGGPVRVSDLPAPVGGPQPDLELTPDWMQVGEYIGRLSVVGSYGKVAYPTGMEGAEQAVAHAFAFIDAAAILYGVPPQKEPVVVLSGPAPEEAAAAAAASWLPDYGPELAWWRQGLIEYNTLRLMDKAKLWPKDQDRDRWVKNPARSDGFRLVIWLDMSLLTQEHTGVNELYRKTTAVRSRDAFLKQVETVGNLNIEDMLDQMLRGRKPLPGL